VVAGVDLRLESVCGGQELKPDSAYYKNLFLPFRSTQQPGRLSIDLLIHHETDHLNPSKLCQSIIAIIFAVIVKIQIQEPDAR